ncbi:MAG: SRPBCC family protein [Acidimicrobiales bacterium]|nr:SRPBCC family protein [Acidimicrobiales bacterium]
MAHREIGARLACTPDIIASSASIEIDASAEDVFAAVSDITRMGEWSPENTGGRWLDDGPALGARFEGDNRVALGPIPLKTWTTTSEVTVYEPNTTFAFVAEGYTTWTFDIAENDGGVTLTESFSYEQYEGFKKLFYDLGGARRGSMRKGMEATLAGIKASLE